MFFIQSFVLFVLACVVFLLDKKLGLSFLYGGFTFLLPQTYFSYRVFQYSGAQKAPLIVKNFYIGEVVKLLGTAILFIVAFKTKLVEPVPLFIGYGVGLVLQWTSPLYVKNLS
jgi:ATP synthase protein I